MDKKAQADFEKKLDNIINNMRHTLDEEPRYQLTGEIIPPEKRGDPPGWNEGSELPE